MKHLKIILASVFALLLLIVTPLSIMAAGQNSNDAAARKPLRVHLAIVQPRLVGVGQNMQLTVFERLNQTPIEGAGVWMIARENGDPAKEALKNLFAKGRANVTLSEVEDILNANGPKLGLTDTNGRLTNTFNESLRGWLVAVKEGYLPGFSHLVVSEFMSIAAPKKAAPGEDVTITVNQRGTDQAVTGADIWAVDFANARALRDSLQEVRQTNQGDLHNVDWDAELGKLATSIGTTDANGQVTHSFEAGKYLLIAIKQGCIPAYAGIAILAPEPLP